MSTKGSKPETTGPVERDGDEWPRVVTFLLLIGSILGVLLLGAALRTDPPVAAPAAVVRPSAEREAILAPPRDEPQGEVDDFLPPESVLDRMARRAGADVERLAAAPQGWTAQLGVFCDPEHVEHLVAGFGDEPALLVLPSYHGDDPCFRICWSRYPGRDAARRAADMPAGLRALLEGDPFPRRLTEVLE